MNEIVRKIVSVADLPEKLREGLDPSRPVAIVQEGEARRESLAEMRARIQAQPGFQPYTSGEEAVDMVRWIRDAEGEPPARWRR